MTSEKYVDLQEDAPKTSMVDGAQVTSNPNGGVEIDFEPKSQDQYIRRHDDDHFANLVDEIEHSTLSTIGAMLGDAIEDDVQSRDEWESCLTVGVELLGFKTDLDKTYPFKGASGVYSPVYLESFLSIIAIARAEILPPKGPADIEMLGEETPELQDRANRVKAYINYYLTDEYKGYYQESELAIMWATIAGSCFKKTYRDPLTNKIKSCYIKPEDFIVNAQATSLEETTRISHKFMLTKKQLRMMQIKGIYKDVQLSPFEDNDDDSTLTEKIKEIEGVDVSSYDHDKLYQLYEVHCDLDIKGLEHEGDDGKPTGLPLPYLVIMEKESKQILSICRNWKPEDKSYSRINIFTQYQFMPGLWFYGYGLAHIAAGTAKAATVMTRQLIDNSYLYNFPGGLRVKSMRNESNEIRIGPLEFKEIDTGGLSISDAVMMMPYKEPSMVAKQVKDDLEEGIRKIVGAATLPIADFNANAPVGTTLALLEQVNRQQSSIMRRFHKAMGDELRIIFELFKDVLPDTPYPFKVKGNKHEIMRKDFNDDLNIIPVSDPNLNSSALRLVRAEALLKMAEAHPDLYDLRKISQQICREMKIDPDQVMMPDQKEEEKPVPLDPISENMMVMQGKPVTAAIWQAHTAHITIHNQLIQSQQQENPEADVSALTAHIQEHKLFEYQLQMEQLTGQQLPDDPSQLPPEAQNQIALQAAQAATQAAQQQAEAQPKPLDPAQVMLEDVKVKAHGIEERAKIDQLKVELETFKVQEEMKRAQEKNELEMFKAQSKDELDRLKTQSKEQFDKLKMEYDFHVKEQELELKQLQFQLAQSKVQMDIAKSESENFSRSSMSEMPATDI